MHSTLKKFFPVGLVASFLLSVVGCSGEKATQGDDANVTTNPTTPQNAPGATAQAATGPDLAACAGRDECVKAAVIAILFASNAEFDKEVDFPKLSTKRAGEVLVHILGGEEHSTFKITTSPGGAGETKVDFNVVTVFPSKEELKNPPEGCLSCNLFEDGIGLNFKFTIKNNKIVETKIPLFVAG